MGGICDGFLLLKKKVGKKREWLMFFGRKKSLISVTVLSMFKLQLNN